MWRLSIFPWLLRFDYFAPTILRLGLAIVVLWFLSSQTISTTKRTNTYLIRLQIIAGGLLFIGLWTQLAALIVALLAGWRLYQGKNTTTNNSAVIVNILIIAASLSLMISGAGGLALDWPL